MNDRRWTRHATAASAAAAAMALAIACAAAATGPSPARPAGVRPVPATEPGVTYPVVDTGQGVCYDDANPISCPAAGGRFAGQDAEHEGRQPAYRDNGDGTVSDLVTGLWWQQDGGGKATFAEATAGAPALRLGGYDDWRLPTIKELYSLILFSGVDPSGLPGTDTSDLVPFLDTRVFAFEYGDTDAGERVIDAQYWSSTEYVSVTMNRDATVFGVNFADGRIKGYPRDRGPGGSAMRAYVRYVRGNPDYGRNRFVDDGDGTIRDEATGLQWARADSAVGLDWEAALAYAADLELAGYTDWRLPNAKELQSIVDYTRSPATTGSPALDPGFSATRITDEGGDADYGYYWTSTTHANASRRPGAFAAYVAFGEALGYMEMPPGSGSRRLVDVHGAGAQRSDPKSGDPADYPEGNGPQGDVVRIHNLVRAVRDIRPGAPTATAEATDAASPEPTTRPTSVPGRTVGLLQREEGASDGYTLLAPIRATGTYLIDMDGQLVHAWTTSRHQPGLSAYLLGDGSLLRTARIRGALSTGGGEGGRIERYDWDGDLIWEMELASSELLQHHDIEPLPNGNLLVLAVEKRSIAEALAVGFDPDRLDPEVARHGYLLPDTVLEIAPDPAGGGTIVWQWRVWDHLVQDNDPSKPSFGAPSESPERVSVDGVGRPVPVFWNHVNAVDYHPELDQILVSVRGNSEVWVIDHSTTTAEAAGSSGGRSGKGGDLLYRWGNPAAYATGGVEDRTLYAQHDAQWVEPGRPGAGQLIAFDNGVGRGHSSVLAWSPPLDGGGNYERVAGRPFGPEAAAWTWVADPPSSLYAEALSGVQRLPNGNTLIADGPQGSLVEVTADGPVVWRYVNPVIHTGPVAQGEAIPLDARGQPYNALFKVRRYAADDPGLQGRDLAPRGPLERYPDATSTPTPTATGPAHAVFLPVAARRGNDDPGR